jgi:hypothetical protein
MMNESSDELTLEYHRPVRRARLSKLAVASMVASLMSFPCIAYPLWHFWVPASWGKAAEAGATLTPVVAFVMSVVGYVRIARSHQMLRGADQCLFACVTCVCWFLLLGIFSVLL